MAQSKGEGGIKFLGFADSSLSARVTYRERPFRLLHLSARTGRRVKRESRFATRGQLARMCSSATPFSKIPCIIMPLLFMYSVSCTGNVLTRLRIHERACTNSHVRTCTHFYHLALVNTLDDTVVPNLLGKLDFRLKRYYSLILDK